MIEVNLWKNRSKLNNQDKSCDLIEENQWNTHAENFFNGIRQPDEWILVYLSQTLRYFTLWLCFLSGIFRTFHLGQIFIGFLLLVILFEIWLCIFHTSC